MYLHIGNNEVIRSGDIIGIFDIENTSISKLTKEFLKTATDRKSVVTVTAELPKSFIVCVKRIAGVSKKDEKRKTAHERVYISQMSTATLKKRADYVDKLAENLE